MTSKQEKILSQFFYQVAELAGQTLAAFVEEEKPVERILLPSDHNTGLLNKKQIAERLGVSERTISNLQNEGLPVVPFGRKRVQFNYEKVLIWLEGREIKKRRKTNLRVVK